MKVFNIHDAKTHLSRLVALAATGEPFIIAKAGRKLVKVIPLDTPNVNQTKRLGFMAKQIEVPDDFDHMGANEIQHLFSGGV